MRRVLLATFVLLAAGLASQTTVLAAGRERLAAAARAVRSAVPSIPADEWRRSPCIAVFPDAKRASASAADGVVSCRAGDRWSAPAFVRLAIAPGRLPAGADAIDIVVLATNGQGAQMLLQDRAQLTSEVASGYVRAGGRVDRLDVSGASLQTDALANRDVYGSGATPRTILASSELSAPTDAHDFLAALSAPAATTARDRAPEPATASPPPARGIGTTGAATPASPQIDDLRARVVALQRLLDGLLTDARDAAADTTPATPGSVVVERSRLLQIRAQLDALLAVMDRRAP